MPEAPPKRIAILGSTGSIGVNALDVVRRLGDGYRVVALAARSNWKRLREQIEEFRPAAVVLTDPEASGELARSKPSCPVEPPDALDDFGGRDDVDFVLGAITGAAGLGACVRAVSAGKTLAVANKESMVVAGPVLIEEARRAGGRILPVDSEHSAAFQAMQSGAPGEVAKIVLTASGGPFLDLPKKKFADITAEQALKHPVWEMGAKITIDSATMMNKALEIIEARWLFGLPAERIEVLVHPQSIVHALVEFTDGSVVAQMGVPDMRVPIQYALTWPERRESGVKRLDLAEVGSLEFRRVDDERFPAIGLGYRAAREGGTMGAVLNAANEVAVEAFLARRIRFPRITEIVAEVVDRHKRIDGPDLPQLLEADAAARESARELAERA
ncbi:MAG: 1-deoxy-D-xylulose-5-phosphate reductoisomerase [Planctomycetota bacterium]|jgi:1-deoxy-D-xylulose-5-phosphate reductoisomerase